ncbi:MAG: fatty acid hydroxylase [Alphaproteobacteria bacterium]|nr:fatty acid hydroxylase [Alphaproteobacteria bacterium]
MSNLALTETAPELERHTPWIVTWLTWPLLFAVNLLIIAHAVVFHWNLSISLAAAILIPIVTLVTLEFLYPLDRRWRMTWRTFFFRDIKFFLAGGLTGAATNYIFGVIGLSLAAGHVGPMTGWPLWIAAPAAIVSFDFFQYWQHRWSHEANTPWKLFLWKTHAAHHLPEQVYVLMHPAGHPFNFVLLQGFIRIPLFYVLGFTPDALFAATVIMALQGVISHCNVDLRAGWFNYIFAGAELHRYHHSANVGEGQNYAVAVSLLDVIFGTFVYRPGDNPERLGVAEPDAYPRSNQFWRIMLIPLR